jgi:hypothetical protein
MLQPNGLKKKKKISWNSETVRSEADERILFHDDTVFSNDVLTDDTR